MGGRGILPVGENAWAILNHSGFACPRANALKKQKSQTLDKHAPEFMDFVIIEVGGGVGL